MLLGLALISTAGFVHADSFCVNSASAITAAVNSANDAAEGVAQDIRVRPGNYAIPAGLQFSPPGDRDNKDFSITGGWNSGCTARVINPAATVISAENGATDGFFSFEGNHPRIVVEGIRFEHFESWRVSEPPCVINQLCPDTQTVRVRYNELRQGKSVTFIAHDAQNFTVSNNLIVQISNSSNGNVPIYLNYADDQGPVQFSFNTVAGIECTAATPALEFHTEGSGTTLHHNILQSSGCLSDLDIRASFDGQPVALRNNLYNTRSGLSATAVSGNVITPSPGFVNAAAGDYRLRDSAPVSVGINAGVTPIQAIQQGLSLPAQDLDGPTGLRVMGSRVDIGAYESAINDSSVLTVTSTNSNGPGSLAQAITSANATAGLQRIEFNIAGACPRLIQLDAPLPDVVDDVEIDGFTQPGASANTQTDGTDAQLCVTILASGGTLDQALQVPGSAPASASLSVKGIAFAGSTGFNGNFIVATRLRGGSDHLIQGNAFAGTGPGAIGVLGTLDFGMQIRGSAQNVLVGGPQPEHRNSFGAMLSSAIALTDATSGGHTIQNNYIGLSADGLQASTIGLNGIFASASPNVRILDNVIASVPNSAAIAITGATATGYQLRGNLLGVSVLQIPAIQFRNAVGIQISNGSGGHEIGSLSGNSQSNLVTNSTGPGIWLNTAGNGTLIRPNRIFGNGISGTGLGIDLGTPGPLANDVGDGDAGPNRGQNTPLVIGSVANPDGSRQVSITLDTIQNTPHRIDIYRSPDCPGSNRGGNMLNRIGTIVTTTSPSGQSSFNFAVSGAGGPAYLTAVTTSLTGLDSSEVSACYLETASDLLFRAGFE